MKTLSLLKFKSSPLRGVTETQKERMIVFQLSLFRGELLSFSRKYCLPYTGFGQLFLRHQKHLPTFRQNHAPPKKWRKKHGVQFFVGTFWICFGYVLDMFYELRNIWSVPKIPMERNHLPCQTGDDTRSRSPRGSRIPAAMCLVLGPWFFGNPKKWVQCHKNERIIRSCV